MGDPSSLVRSISIEIINNFCFQNEKTENPNQERWIELLIEKMRDKGSKVRNIAHKIFHSMSFDFHLDHLLIKKSFLLGLSHPTSTKESKSLIENFRLFIFFLFHNFFIFLFFYFFYFLFFYLF